MLHEILKQHGKWHERTWRLTEINLLTKTLLEQKLF